MGTRVLLALAGVVLVLTGCEERAPAPGETTPRTDAGRVVDEVVTRSKEAAREIRPHLEQAGARLAEAARTGRDEVVRVANQAIEENRPEIERLRERGRALTGQAREDFDAAMARVDERAKDVADRLDRVRAEPGEAWRNMSAEIGEGLRRLGEAMSEAARKLEGR
ncbi:MAG TPA: hypothetical protein VD963_08275 [Phycisphaerales bacterium]|nr:hypothetical protein [Phycisphaerales bacterium]